MKTLLMILLACPMLLSAELSKMRDIKVQILRSEEIPGLYLIKWEDTYWSPVEILPYCDGDVPENQTLEPPEFPPLESESRSLDSVLSMCL